MIRRETLYFDKVGTENTPVCQDLLEKAVAEGWRHAVVASTTGVSGAEAARRLAGKGANLVVVGHSVGYKGPNIDEFLPEHYQEITRLGGKVLKATILTHSLEAALPSSSRAAPPPCSWPTPCGAWGRASRSAARSSWRRWTPASSRKARKWWRSAAPPGVGTRWPSSARLPLNGFSSSPSWKSGPNPGCKFKRRRNGRPSPNRAVIINGSPSLVYVTNTFYKELLSSRPRVFW